MHVQQVGVLGCGLMGSGIAQGCVTAFSESQIVTLNYKRSTSSPRA